MKTKNTHQNTPAPTILIQKLTKHEPPELFPSTAAVAALAGEIWREHFTPIIGAAQVEYMLEKFQSAERIYDDIKNNNYTYFTATEANKNELVAYCAVAPKADYAFLSKLYVRRDFRGKGLAHNFLNEIYHLCHANYALNRIRLTVNKGNSGPIAAYKKLGFQTIEEVKTDIGGGFYMDDYIMELAVPNIK